MQGGDSMLIDVTNELENFGYVTYNPFYDTINNKRYCVITPLEEITPIDMMSAKDFVVYCRKYIQLFNDFLKEHSLQTSLNFIYFEISAQDSYYEWSPELCFDDYEQARKFSEALDMGYVYDVELEEIIWNEDN